MKVSSILFGANAPQFTVFCGKKQSLEPNGGSSVREKTEDEKIWLALCNMAGIRNYTGKISEADKLNAINALSSGGYGAIQSPDYNPTITKYTRDYMGLPLLSQNNALNKDCAKYQKAISDIQEIGYKKLTSSRKLPSIKKSNPVVWSVTSEFAPVKEGGLGAVPVQLRSNMTGLGIQIPTFIPMYLNEGNSTFSEIDGKCVYNYKGKEFNLEKVMSFKMDTFKNSNPDTINAEIYLSRDKDKNGQERQLVFVKCDKYFDGTIYEANAKTEEPEKFAVMSKAIYELAKIKTEGIRASKDVKIDSMDALNSIKAPDAMILNDWQASPLAALLRYKPEMENAYGQLGDNSADKLKSMPIITIGHNVTYQGSTQNDNNKEQKTQTTSNILNTLFDKYTYDIVSNATLRSDKFRGKYPKNLDNVLVLRQQGENESFTNFLNMGIVLSDYFCPVSENYAKELISPERKDLSWNLQHALIQKAKAGKLKGIINGNDFRTLSIKAKAPDMKKLTGVDLLTYDKASTNQEIASARSQNKINFYNDFILPFSESEQKTEEEIANVKKISSRLEFYKGEQGTSLPYLTDKELLETPIFTSGGRLVSQKGMSVLSGAIEKLYTNWEKDFPNRPKPIFYLGGQDGEGGTQRKIIEDLKNYKLSKEDNNRVLFAHGFVPMPAMMASSDFFLMPSLFEPCGLTQGESFAVGTPVIASAVGGIADTVNRNGKENGILTPKDELPNEENFYEALKQGLEIYFDDKDRYNAMIKNSIDEDFSWVQKGKTGPVYDYLEILGIKRENLPDAE